MQRNLAAKLYSTEAKQEGQSAPFHFSPDDVKIVIRSNKFNSAPHNANLETEMH
jgi:hypothetical protein